MSRPTLLILTLFFYSLPNFADKTSIPQNIQEDCNSFTPKNITIQKLKTTPESWALVEVKPKGLYQYMTNHPTKTEAEAALNIIKKYKYTAHCFIGRPKPSMEYWK